MRQTTDKNENPTDSGRILRVSEAAARLGLSPWTLSKLRPSKGGPSRIRVGKRAVGYRVSDLDAWAESRREG